MKGGKGAPADPVAVAALAAVAVVLVLLHGGSSWLRSLGHSLSAVVSDPVSIAVAVLLVLLAVALVILRVLLTRRLLADRVAFALVPSEGFDPSLEAVLAFAAGLSRVRRARLGWLAPRACAVRVRLQSLPGGRLLYVLEVPRSSLGVLRAAVAAYDGVELREAATLEAAETEPREEREATVLEGSGA